MNDVSQVAGTHNCCDRCRGTGEERMNWRRFSCRSIEREKIIRIIVENDIQGIKETTISCECTLEWV
jgi:hypothetical protein